jgi:hypothetical protein
MISFAPAPITVIPSSMRPSSEPSRNGCYVLDLQNCDLKKKTLLLEYYLFYYHNRTTVHRAFLQITTICKRNQEMEID